MRKTAKTWWGNRFIEALETTTDPGRLKRGRTYANSSRIRNLEMNQGTIRAQVRGNKNAYFGVEQEPTYQVMIAVRPLSSEQWKNAIAKLSSNASFISRLLLNEVPDNLEEMLGVNLLPRVQTDLQTVCSCPDWGGLCKHIAGVCYQAAAELDQDPLLLFELRGLSRDQLLLELAKSPLGQALTNQLESQAIASTAIDSYYTQPELRELPNLTPQAFWHGSKPSSPPQPAQSAIAGILIKKQGDFPAFWQRENSFIEAMEALYERVKTKNRDVL
jgi:uncharacterized Zn finger protein